MSVLKRKRNTSKVEFVRIAYEIEKKSIDLAKRMSARNARIFQNPVVRLASIHADTTYIANEIYPTTLAEYHLRTALLSISKATLHALDKKLSNVYESLMDNPSDAFNRKNGKAMPRGDAVRILDGMAEELGCMIDEEDALISGIRSSDKKKFSKLPDSSLGSDTKKLMSEMLQDTAFVGL